MIKTPLNAELIMCRMLWIKRTGGRPSGRMKTSKIEIAIEPEIKEEFMEILRSEGKKASVEIGSWIREYKQNA